MKASLRRRIWQWVRHALCLHNGGIKRHRVKGKLCWQCKRCHKVIKEAL